MTTFQDLLALTQKVTQFLSANALKICTAESCTGGYLAQMLTRLPGSSSWFDMGVVTYSNTAKQQLLAIPPDLITQNGAVSEAVASAMAKNVLTISVADLSIAITGIAGPGGGSADKPVGTVWFACARRNHKIMTHCAHFEGDREAVRKQSVSHALQMIISSQD
jgi:nicotinamide-nucleotide amidase